LRQKEEAGRFTLETRAALETIDDGPENKNIDAEMEKIEEDVLD